MHYVNYRKQKQETCYKLKKKLENFNTIHLLDRGKISTTFTLSIQNKLGQKVKEFFIKKI